MANNSDRNQKTSADTGSDPAQASRGDGNVADASDQLEETLQSGLHAFMVRLKLADEGNESNALLALFRNHPALSVGAATVVGGIAGLVIRRFNPIRGSK